MAAAVTDSLDNSVYATATGVEAEPQLFADVGLSSYQLLTATLRFDRQKLVFAPGRLFETYRPVLSEIRLNASQSGGTTTLGLGTGYNGAAPDGDRALGIAREIVSRLPERESGESLEAYDRRIWPRIVHEFRETLARRVVLASVGVNWQLFEVIGGTPVDADGDERTDNAHRLKAWDVAGSISYARNTGSSVQASYHFTRRRASAEEGSELVTHHGGSVSGAIRVATLDADYRDSEEYRRTLFVPSIVLGLGIEGQRCDGDAVRCQDAVRDRWTFTPFVDFRLAQTNQFRVGLPVERLVRFGDESSVELRPVFQFGIQLAGP